MTMLSRSSALCKRRGLTLVEVVAGLALLAALAVGGLLAFGAHQRQLRQSALRLEAATLADRLLTEWYAGSGYVPRPAWGVFPDAAGWRWHTRPVARGRIDDLEIETVRLEVFAAGNAHASQPAVVVDLLAPLR